MARRKPARFGPIVDIYPEKGPGELEMIGKALRLLAELPKPEPRAVKSETEEQAGDTRRAA